MNSTKIDDSTAVKALLDRLRASRLWQDTLNSSSSRISLGQRADVHESPASALGDVHGQSRAQSQLSNVGPPASASVASLLSQLRTSEWISTSPSSDTHTTHQKLSRSTPQSSQNTPTQVEHRTPRSATATSSVPAQDIRSISFQQALPHLTQLASDPEFLTAVSRLWEEQNELEQQLWEERQAIRRKHEEKVKVARTKATMIGVGLSKHEADMMNDAYRRDLERFDKERVLLAWDAVTQKQQEALETLGVPTMFATTSQSDCQKQRRVVQVLEGLY